jgi:hypothetical protein
MESHAPVSDPVIEEILYADRWAREAAVQWVAENGGGLVK